MEALISETWPKGEREPMISDLDSRDYGVILYEHHLDLQDLMERMVTLEKNVANLSTSAPGQALRKGRY
jgi:hypothetical protein